MKIINLLSLIVLLSFNSSSYGENFTPVLDRTPQVQFELEKTTGRSASEITKEDLLKVIVLDLNIDPVYQLKQGDFDDLDNLEYLGLHKTSLKSVPEGIFDGLINLASLDLSENQLTKLPEKIFHPLVQLKYLHLQGNQLTKLPKSLFNDLMELVLLNISDNPLTKLPKKILNSLAQIKILILNLNSDEGSRLASAINTQKKNPKINKSKSCEKNFKLRLPR